MRFLLILILMLSGCTVMATRQGDTLVMKGFGANKAVWSDGASLEKSEPFKVPDLLFDK